MPPPHSAADWVVGDHSGIPIPADPAALRAGGTGFLTRVFLASGTLGDDSAVTEITQCQEVSGGSTGRKLLLSVEYHSTEPGLRRELFVKFSRDLHDAARDRRKTQMAAEVRFAALSRTPKFPIAVPRPLFADYHRDTGTGILITERIMFGTNGIEPQYQKCLDYAMPEPLEHYRALLTALGRLVGYHQVSRFLKVAFVPNFSVKNAHRIYPAADLSEQISTAGKEASGTGNMKFMINGALTIGTLDGANVEMRDEVGPENFFLFGLTESEVEDIKANGYRPADYIDGNDELRVVLELIASGTVSHGDTEVFRPLVDNLRHDDPFLVLADYAAYVACQEQVSAAGQDKDAWTKMSILNTARSGKFSSDRAIAEYCDDIWKGWPLTVNI